MMSGGRDYQDQDQGDDIYYCGTNGTEGKIGRDTPRLIESYNGIVEVDEEGNESVVKHPVRVIRSHKLVLKKSKYAPRAGFRYDGLYDVLDYEILNREKQIHRFHLKRCAGQDPIRYDGFGARPMREEVRALKRLGRKSAPTTSAPATAEPEATSGAESVPPPGTAGEGN